MVKWNWRKSRIIFPRENEHLVIQYFDSRKGGLQSKLIEFTNKANETADKIATYTKDTLEKRMILKKCVEFTEDNCNTMFGVLRRNEQGNNAFAKLKKTLNPSLIRVGCSAHVLKNCIHHGAERMNIDIEININVNISIFFYSLS